jgi:excisionase family DNA binding protein
MEEIYTIPEVARYLKLSKSKVYYLVQIGEIPHLKIGRNVRIRENDLKRWIDRYSDRKPDQVVGIAGLKVES